MCQREGQTGLDQQDTKKDILEKVKEVLGEMKLGLTIFIWIVVTYLIFMSLAYVVAIVGTIVLAVKGKKDRKEFREKRNREWIEKEKEFENRMKERREEFYKRNKHITKDFDKHFKE